MRRITNILETQTPNAFLTLYAEGTPARKSRGAIPNECRRCKNNTSQVKLRIERKFVECESYSWLVH
jgi:hypothetical protein